jgi:hypothetical protein
VHPSSALSIWKRDRQSWSIVTQLELRIQFYHFAASIKPCQPPPADRACRDFHPNINTGTEILAHTYAQFSEGIS